MPPPRPPTTQFWLQKPSAEAIRQAEARRRIEASYKTEVPLKEIMNEDRARFGWAPLE